MRYLLFVALTCGICISCADDSKNDANIEEEPATEESQTPVVCRPVGRWRLEYKPSEDLKTCTPGNDVLRIKSITGSKAVVEFLGREPDQSTCSPNIEPIHEVTAEFSPDTCTLSARNYAEWCTSGEGQCDERKITVAFNDQNGKGTIRYRRCWCGGSGGGVENQLELTATREW